MLANDNYGGSDPAHGDVTSVGTKAILKQAQSMICEDTEGSTESALGDVPTGSVAG